ncbi:hypothetical protein B9Z55_019025 [Caenorhabditis nigoni]|uniref:2,3-diketo-5-methylthio-1-phosphopentane phosphatase n=1 Tax=Caenorhabditis nigoni TaxID=1611254 RepID=A0A2G5THE5_9PELO|nr:hypothetical protein B9Z55_019025 [Caenorhabditis nigoni]
MSSIFFHIRTLIPVMTNTTTIQFNALLLDIEGTITSISFVKDELFPYAFENVGKYLEEHYDKPATQIIIEDLRRLAEQQLETDAAVVKIREPKQECIEDVTKNVRHWIKRDKKLTPMKALQGLIWEEAYQRGYVKGHVYPDVLPILKIIENRKIPIYIYSSGSVHAQKLLFANSVEGDMTKILYGYFDTNIGLKGETSSYTKISEQIGVPEKDILFLTDVEAEAAAASVFQEERDNFDADNIRKAHEKDKVDEKEWTLIYRDVGASRTFYMTAAFLPCFIIGSTIFAIDINTNSPSNRFDFVQKLVTDAEELGTLIVLPSLALTVVIAFLARVQQLRLIRIYQNKKDTESFMAIRSKLLVTQHKALFRRDETTGFYFAEDQTDGARVALHFLFGNIQIGNRKFMIMDDMFKANNYRSYMLNETSVPPRLYE